MQWNASHAHAYINSSLCGSVEMADDVVVGDSSSLSGARTSTESVSSESMDEAGGVTDGGRSLLVGAWRGAPDGEGADQLGGYYNGLLDNLQVCFRAVQPRMCVR